MVWLSQLWRREEDVVAMNVSFSRLLQITCGDMETAQASLEPGHERHVDQPRQHRGRDVCPRQQHRYSPQSLGGGGQAAK